MREKEFFWVGVPFSSRRSPCCHQLLRLSPPFASNPPSIPTQAPPNISLQNSPVSAWTVLKNASCENGHGERPAAAAAEDVAPAAPAFARDRGGRPAVAGALFAAGAAAAAPAAAAFPGAAPPPAAAPPLSTAGVSQNRGSSPRAGKERRAAGLRFFWGLFFFFARRGGVPGYERKGEGKKKKKRGSKCGRHRSSVFEAL